MARPTGNNERPALLLKDVCKLLFSIMHECAQSNLTNSTDSFKGLPTLQLLIGFVQYIVQENCLGGRKPTFILVLKAEAPVQSHTSTDEKLPQKVLSVRLNFARLCASKGL